LREKEPYFSDCSLLAEVSPHSAHKVDIIFDCKICRATHLWVAEYVSYHECRRTNCVKCGADCFLVYDLLNCLTCGRCGDATRVLLIDAPQDVWGSREPATYYAK
jgi:hypothetical protein